MIVRHLMSKLKGRVVGINEIEQFTGVPEMRQVVDSCGVHVAYTTVARLIPFDNRVATPLGERNNNNRHEEEPHHAGAARVHDCERICIVYASTLRLYCISATPVCVH